MDVPLDDKPMSRHRAMLTVRGGQACLEDLGSRNGARVNGQRVQQSVTLRSGDVIGMGGTQMVFHRSRP